MKYTIALVAVVAVMLFALPAEANTTVEQAENTKIVAERGDPLGQMVLGQLYLTGVKEAGIEKNEQEAAKWIKKAADQDYPQAIFLLAMMYNEGRGG